MSGIYMLAGALGGWGPRGVERVSSKGPRNDGLGVLVEKNVTCSRGATSTNAPFCKFDLAQTSRSLLPS